MEILKPLNLPEGARLVTLHVKSLYTNILHNERTEVIRNFMLKRTNEKKANMLAELTNLVLTNNIFEFNGIIYQQTSGTAIVTRMAPSDANIYMSEFCEKIFTILTNTTNIMEKIHS